jgi:hypothetical protein
MGEQQTKFATSPHSEKNGTLKKPKNSPFFLTRAVRLQLLFYFKAQKNTRQTAIILRSLPSISIDVAYF